MEMEMEMEVEERAGHYARVLQRCSQQRPIRQIQGILLASGLLQRSTLLHDSLIRSFSRSPSPSLSLPLYPHLLRSHLLPTPNTFPSLLKAISLTISSSMHPHHFFSLSIHAHAIRLGLASFLLVNNALIRLHSLLGPSLSAAVLLFRTAAFTDASTFNTLITAYSKAGRLRTARLLFDQMPLKNVISWSAIINASVQAGHSRDALHLFSRMLARGFRPHDTTLVGVLAACAHLGALGQGKWVHGYLRANEARITVFLGTALIDMYAKCGEVQLALEVFVEMKEKNVLAWTTMIKGLAMHGRGSEALELFSRMESSEGIRPDDIAFIGALCACTHAGLVDKGRQIFESMAAKYGIQPKMEHYGCMVDLLARNGSLTEARDLVDKMPMRPDALIWGALMAGCRFHKNVELAEDVIRHWIELEPDKSGAYVLLSNIYAASGRHGDARGIRQLMRDKGVEKTPGCSTVEIRGAIHQFIVGDTCHPQMREIVAKWEEVEGRIRLEEEYVPDKKEVLLDVEEEEKEGALSRHSEKLAIAFALISTSEGATIRIVKNLRVCHDCHHVTKLVSKVYAREIVVRDRTRFHLFKDGTCSCNDYW